MYKQMYKQNNDNNIMDQSVRPKRDDRPYEERSIEERKQNEANQLIISMQRSG